MVWVLWQLGSDVDKVWHEYAKVQQKLILVGIPGGFYFGDYLRCGAHYAMSR